MNDNSQKHLPFNIVGNNISKNNIIINNNDSNRIPYNDNIPNINSINSNRLNYNLYDNIEPIHLNNSDFNHIPYNFMNNIIPLFNYINNINNINNRMKINTHMDGNYDNYNINRNLDSFNL